MESMPNWEAFMGPTLSVLSDGVHRSRRELGPEVAQKIGLSDSQIRDVLASGQLVYQNRIGWGLSFLSNVGALSRPQRGVYTITDSGRMLLERFPNGISERDIRELGEDPDSPIRIYVPAVAKTPSSVDVSIVSSHMTPTEQVQSGISRINEDVAADLLSRLLEREPEFFEHAVVNLLLGMGYGGVGGSGNVTQLTNDGGIDGVIDQDVLGLSKVYIQAKRYKEDNPVQRPEVQAFVGALSGKADSGVFITTSRFTEGASTYASSVPTRIILIDGKKLTSLMIRFGVGVQVRDTYKVVEVDEDFFT